MKIAFISDGAYAYASGARKAVGGAERDQWLLGTALAKFGWSVRVGVHEVLQPGTRRNINDVEFVGIGHGHVLLDWYRFLMTERPDWLFWECAYHLWGPLVELAKLAGVRTIFATGCDLDVEPRQYRFHKSHYWRLYAWGLARTDKIFVQHAGQLSGLCPRWLPKTSILPKVCLFGADGCAPVNLQPHAERANYVAWVGTLVELKRPDILMEIARRSPTTRFVVCGGINSSPPAYGERIADQLRAIPNIEYLGQVPPDDAQRVIEEASVLLCTSDIEGFPNTFVQAWSSGTPVVSLKVDPDHIISRSGLGTISGEMSKALEDIAGLMASPQQRDQIAKRAREFVEENYSAAKVVNLFTSALNGNRL